MESFVLWYGRNKKLHIKGEMKNERAAKKVDSAFVG